MNSSREECTSARAEGSNRMSERKSPAMTRVNVETRTRGIAVFLLFCCLMICLMATVPGWNRRFFFVAAAVVAAVSTALVGLAIVFLVIFVCDEKEKVMFQLDLKVLHTWQNFIQEFLKNKKALLFEHDILRLDGNLLF